MRRKKNGSLLYQINEQLKSLQRFGQSRHEAKLAYRAEQEAKGERWNPATADGIYAYKTFDAYKQTAMEFSAWLKTSHPEVKNLGQIGQEVAVSYLQQRQADGKSGNLNKMPRDLGSSI